jgi:hypothetical protein
MVGLTGIYELVKKTELQFFKTEALLQLICVRQCAPEWSYR